MTMSLSLGLRLILVDDEPLARLRLRSLLAEIPDPPVTVVAEAGDAASAERAVSDAEADLVLLDIGLPGPGGLTLARRLASGPRAPAIVFVTAHAEHAVTAFELEAIDYLTKPVSRERLQAALRRVAQRRWPLGGEPVSDAAVLVVSDRGRMLRLPLDEVLYLKAELKYVTLRTVERSYVLDDALSDLEQRLGDGFLRVHRNALVARRAVRELARRPGDDAEFDGGEGWAVRVAPADEWLAVSRRQLTAVRQALAAD
jgi:two-component system, LytTR family, response regulator AlgR